MHIRRFIFFSLAASVALCWLANGATQAQSNAPQITPGRRPSMPPKPPILPATNGRPPAFQPNHGLFGNAQGTTAAGQMGQAGQGGQGGQGGLGGGGGAFGAAGGGLGAFGQFGNAGGGIGGLIGGLGGGGLKGFGLGGGFYSSNSPYRDGVGLTGGADRLSGKDAELELPRRANPVHAGFHRLMLQPARDSR